MCVCALNDRWLCALLCKKEWEDVFSKKVACKQLGLSQKCTGPLHIPRQPPTSADVPLEDPATSELQSVAHAYAPHLESVLAACAKYHLHCPKVCPCVLQRTRRRSVSHQGHTKSTRSLKIIAGQPSDLLIPHLHTYRTAGSPRQDLSHARRKRVSSSHAQSGSCVFRADYYAETALHP